MRVLNFIVNGQTMTQDPDCDFTRIVQGTSNYLITSFTFSKDWDGLVKVAEFRVGVNDRTISPVPIINGRCFVPPQITDARKWSVRIVGKKGDIKVTTNTVRVIQERR